MRPQLLRVGLLLATLGVAHAQTTLYWSEDDGYGFTTYVGSNGPWDSTSQRWALVQSAPVNDPPGNLGSWGSGAIAAFTQGGSGLVRTLTLNESLSLGGFHTTISRVTVDNGGSNSLTLTGAAPEFYLYYPRSLALNVSLVGSAGFKIVEPGSMSLNAASPSLSGNVEISNGGIFVGHQAALGTANVLIGDVTHTSYSKPGFLIFDDPAGNDFAYTISNPLTFSNSTGSYTEPPLVMVGSAYVSSAYAIRSATLTGALTLASNATLAAGGTTDVGGTNYIGRGALGTNTSLIVSSTISETGGSYQVLIQGDVTMSGSNSFTGRVQVGDRSDSRLTVPVFNDNGTAGPLGAGSGLVLGMRYQDEGYLYYKGEVVYTGGTATSDRTIQIDPGGTGTITVANAPTALTLSGVISNNAAGINVNFKKDGPGTLNLTAVNTYIGATTVNAGTLLVNNVTGSGVGTGTLTVKNGATLGGAGFIGAAATFESGALLAPGNSPGTLTFNSGLTLNTGSVLDFQLGTISDLINVTGGVLTGPGGTGGITLNLFDSGGFAPATYVLFDFTGATPSDFDPGDFALGSTLSGYSYNLAFNGNLLELTATSAIPEPATYAALAGLAGLAAAVRRKRGAR